MGMHEFEYAADMAVKVLDKRQANKTVGSSIDVLLTGSVYRKMRCYLSALPYIETDSPASLYLCYSRRRTSGLQSPFKG